jgi:hypothetical protein
MNDWYSVTTAQTSEVASWKISGDQVSANGLVRSPIMKINGTEKVCGEPSLSEMLCSVSVMVEDEWSMARYGKEVARPQVGGIPSIWKLSPSEVEFQCIVLQLFQRVPISMISIVKGLHGAPLGGLILLIRCWKCHDPTSLKLRLYSTKGHMDVSQLVAVFYRLAYTWLKEVYQ